MQSPTTSKPRLLVADNAKCQAYVYRLQVHHGEGRTMAPTITFTGRTTTCVGGSRWTCEEGDQITIVAKGIRSVVGTLVYIDGTGAYYRMLSTDHAYYDVQFTGTAETSWDNAIVLESTLPRPGSPSPSI